MTERGQVVAALGPDGSGKSTVIQGLIQKAIADSLYNAIHHYHWRPGLLPQLSTLGGRRDRTRRAVRDFTPHRAPPASVVSSSFRVSYYAADYLLAWTAIAAARLRGALILFDRYFDDFLVDPLRTRLDPRARWPHLLSNVVPRPDKTLVLVCPPEEAHRRKPELPVAEIERQQALYRALANERSDWHVVNAGRPAHVVIAEACDIVFGP